MFRENTLDRPVDGSHLTPGTSAHGNDGGVLPLQGLPYLLGIENIAIGFGGQVDHQPVALAEPAIGFHHRPPVTDIGTVIGVTSSVNNLSN